MKIKPVLFYCLAICMIFVSYVTPVWAGKSMMLFGLPVNKSTEDILEIIGLPKWNVDPSSAPIRKVTPSPIPTTTPAPGAAFDMAWLWILVCVLEAGIIVALLFFLNRRKKRILSLQKTIRKRDAQGRNETKSPQRKTYYDVPSIGKVHHQGAREYQQDTFGVSDLSMNETHGVLAVVADGMGGLHDSGQVSVKAVETILDAFVYSQRKDTLKELFLNLIYQANRSVNQLLGPAQYRKSGSTIIMALVRDHKLFFLGIGDSRIYLFRGGCLMQLNREHIYENDLSLRAVNGELSVKDALTNPKRGGLTSFLGMGTLQAVDLPSEPLELLPGDMVVLMSDGVYNALNEKEISACLSNNAQEAAERLQDAVNEKHFANQDNYTAIVIEV